MSRERVGMPVIVLLVLWITSCGQSGAGSNTVQSPPAFFQMVDALSDGFSYAYAPSIILKNGTYHVFFCSMALLHETPYACHSRVLPADGRGFDCADHLLQRSRYLLTGERE